MGIQKDAGEIRAYIYQKYLSEKSPVFVLKPEDIEKETGWEVDRVQRDLRYLKQEELISSHTKNDYIVVPAGVTPNGIRTIENQDKFKGLFWTSFKVIGRISGLTRCISHSTPNKFPTPNKPS